MAQFQNVQLWSEKVTVVLVIPPKHFQGSWQAPYWAGPAAWRFVFLFPNFWCDAALLTSEFSRPVFPLKCLQCVLMSGRCLRPIFFRIISIWFERRYFKHISLKLRELNEQYIKQINVDGRLQGQDPPGENGPWPAFQLERYPFKQLTRRECWKLSKTKVDQNINIVLWHADIVKTIDWKVPAASQKRSAPKPATTNCLLFFQVKFYWDGFIFIYIISTTIVTIQQQSGYREIL